MKKAAVLSFSAILFVFAALAAAGADDGTSWKLVDGVVATVDGTPVLRSDIHMEADLGLLGTGAESHGFDDLLQVYLNRVLILREVDEVGGYRLASGEAEDAYQGYLEEYPDISSFEEKLVRWGVDEVEVFRMLESALLTTLYTESRLQFLVNVLPSDIEDAYRKDPERWGGQGPYDSWETIRADLIGETFAAEKKRWLDTLRVRYKLILLNGPRGTVQ